MSGRGGRGRTDRFSDNFNPMEDDYYNSDINSYDCGPAGKVRPHDAKKRSNDLVKVHVSNIPSDMTQKGLAQVFKDYDGKNPILGKNNTDHVTRWGFIEFENTMQAQRAINDLNKQPPFNLRVSYAKSSGDKSEKEAKSVNQPKDDDNFSFKSGSVPPMASRGRGMSMGGNSMQGAPPSYLRSRPADEESYNGASDYGNDYGSSFNSPRDNPRVDASNALFSRREDQLYENGQRKVSMGRGSFITDKDNDIPVPMVTAENLESKVSAYIHSQYRQKACSEEFIPANNMLAIPFRLKPCSYCSRAALYVCSRCKIFYCSEDCRFCDYVAHKPVCVPRKIEGFNGNGELIINDDHKFGSSRSSCAKLDDPEAFEPKTIKNDRYSVIDKPRNANSSPRINDRGYDDESDYPSDRKSNSRGSGSEFEQRNQPRDFNNSSVKGGYKDNRNGDRRNNNNRKGGNGNNRSSGSEIADYSEQSKRISGSTSEKEELPREPPKKIEPPKISNIENGVYVRKDAGSMEVLGQRRDPTNRKSGGPMNKAIEPSFGLAPEPPVVQNQKVLPAPIPMDKYSIVMVTEVCKGPQLEFWGLPEKDILHQMKFLNIEKGEPLKHVEAGMVVCAEFDGEWFRAEVKKVEGDKASVMYIDFGNEATVPRGSLCDLELAVASAPPLIHKFVLPEHPDNPKLENDLRMALKPIRQVGDKWLVHAENVPYKEGITQEEVSILNKTENQGVFWVRNKSHNLKEMIATLNEHAEIKVDSPKVGELYAFTNDSRWFRVKVLKNAPLTLQCIDNGQMFLPPVHKKHIHPLPFRYATLPAMAYLIKGVDKESSDILSKSFRKSTVLITHLHKEGDVSVCQIEESPGGKPRQERTPRKSDDSSSEHSFVQKKKLIPRKIRPVEDELKNLNLNETPEHLLYLLESCEKAYLHVERVWNDEFLVGHLSIDDPTPQYNSIANCLSRECKKSTDFKPELFLDAAAIWQNQWYRVNVRSFDKNTAIVALIDRAKVVTANEFAPLPSEIAELPEPGVKVILNNSICGRDMIGKRFLLTKAIIKKDIDRKNDMALLDIEGLGDAFVLKWTPMIEEVGLKSVNLPSTADVKISAYDSPKSVYVQSTKKEDLLLLAEINQEVTTSTMMSEPLSRLPLSGELVAAKYEGEYYRAKIFKKKGDKYKVVFVDYGNTEFILPRDMKTLPEKLKLAPCCAVKIQLKGFPDEPFPEPCIKLLNTLSANGAEFKLEYEGDYSQAVLVGRDGTTVNDILYEIFSPTWEKKDFDPIKEQVFTYEDLIYEKWTEGSKLEVAIARVDRYDRIGVLDVNSDLLRHIESNLTPKINQYCTSKSVDPYVPRINEVCLVKYEEDGQWYRAVCLEHFHTNSSKVTFIDYGNTGIAPHTDIRKMVKDFMSTPVAFRTVFVYGYPEKLPESAAKKLEAFLKDLKTEAIVVKVSDSETVICIPELFKTAERLEFEMKKINW